MTTARERTSARVWHQSGRYGAGVVAMSKEASPDKDFVRCRMLWLEQVYSDRKLTSTTKEAAFHLSWHFNRKRFANTGILDACPSYDFLANKMGVSVKTIYRTITALRDGNYLETAGGRGRNNTLRYHAKIRPFAVPGATEKTSSVPDKTGQTCLGIEKKQDIFDPKTGHLAAIKPDASDVQTSLNNPMKNSLDGECETDPAFQPFKAGWSLIVFYELSKGPGKLPRPGSTFMREMIEVQKRQNMILAHQARHGWPDINRMFQNPLALPASALADGVGNIALEMESVMADSAKWVEWKHEFDRRGWPFPSDANGMCFPCGGVKKLDAFMNEIAQKSCGAVA